MRNTGLVAPEMLPPFANGIPFCQFMSRLAGKRENAHVGPNTRHDPRVPDAFDEAVFVVVIETAGPDGVAIAMQSVAIIIVGVELRLISVHSAPDAAGNQVLICRRRSHAERVRRFMKYHPFVASAAVAHVAVVIAFRRRNAGVVICVPMLVERSMLVVKRRRHGHGVRHLLRLGRRGRIKMQSVGDVAQRRRAGQQQHHPDHDGGEGFKFNVSRRGKFVTTKGRQDGGAGWNDKNHTVQTIMRLWGE
jgi:hypothetical protein